MESNSVREGRTIIGGVKEQTLIEDLSNRLKVTRRLKTVKILNVQIINGGGFSLHNLQLIIRIVLVKELIQECNDKCKNNHHFFDNQ